jgi:GNAT superfamily N-acetyltransferase
VKTRFNEFELRLEGIKAIQHEIETLHRKHYHETETKYLAHPFKADYDGFARLEAAGGFLCYTGRKHATGQLVGYLMYFISRSLHGSYQTAQEDAYYVIAECRGAGLARQLLRSAEADLAARGVDYAFQSSKQPVGGPNIGPMLEVEGYVEVARVYCKRLGV